MKVLKSYQHDPLGRQCNEAVKIKNMDPDKLINSRKEYHQPGDVQVVYQKNENEFMTNRKNKNIKETIQDKKDQTKETESIQSSKDKENNPSKIEFIKKMRFESELKKKNNANQIKHCEKCEFETTCKEDVQRHMQSIHEKQRYTCDKCDFQATNHDDLQKHMQSIHQKGSYNCNQCDYTAVQKVDLKTHIQCTHENVSYNCNKCDYTAAQKRDLKTHIQSAHEDIQDEDITSTQNMINDSRARKDQKGKASKCENCDFKTTSVTILKQHVKRVHLVKTTNSKRIYCNKCDKKFNKESTYKAHMKKAHNENGNNEDSSQENSITKIQNINNINLTFQETFRTLRSNKNVDSALDLNS